MSSTPPSSEAQGTSTRPYLIRALHDWCTDNGFTPYVAVHVDASVQVPMEYVKGGEIVLNVGFEATSGLKLGNEFIEFRARFGGMARDIIVPVDHVVAIYARENGQGMAFPQPSDASGAAAAPTEHDPKGARTDAPARGLRLAGTDDGADDNAAKPTDAPASPPEPTPPAAPGGGRPSLKRVK
jgi:stringent starvation protein B